MRPVKPYMRYIGVTFIAALLTLVSIKARASEPDATCLEAMSPEAGVVYDRREAGMPDALNRILIRTEPRYLAQGRWILLRFLDALEAAPSASKADILPPFMAAVCALPAIPAAAPIYRSEFDKPKDI